MCVAYVALNSKGEAIPHRPRLARFWVRWHRGHSLHAKETLTPLASTLRSTDFQLSGRYAGALLFAAVHALGLEGRRLNRFKQVVRLLRFGRRPCSLCLQRIFIMQTIARASVACLALSCVLLCAADTTTHTISPGACNGFPYTDIGQKFHYTTEVTISGNDTSCIR